MEATPLYAPTIEVEDHSIADTCLLVVLEQKRISTRKRADKATEARIRAQEGDDTLTINRHLFKGGEVRDLFTIMRQAYDVHKAMTAPWVDKGPRILPGARFDDYATKMEDFKDQLAEKLPDVIARWPQLVAEDIQRRTAGGHRGVSTADYPDRYRASRAFQLEWRAMPVPKTDDFRVEVPDYVKRKQQDMLQHAVEGIRADLLRRMLEPVQAAAEKLSVPIGEKGSVFRDSLVGNLKAAVEQAKSLNINNDPDIDALIASLDKLLQGDAQSPKALRELADARQRTASQLTDIANRFKGLA